MCLLLSQVFHATQVSVCMYVVTFPAQIWSPTASFVHWPWAMRSLKLYCEGQKRSGRPGNGGDLQIG